MESKFHNPNSSFSFSQDMYREATNRINQQRFAPFHQPFFPYTYLPPPPFLAPQNHQFLEQSASRDEESSRFPMQSLLPPPPPFLQPWRFLHQFAPQYHQNSQFLGQSERSQLVMQSASQAKTIQDQQTTIYEQRQQLTMHKALNQQLIKTICEQQQLLQDKLEVRVDLSSQELDGDAKEVSQKQIGGNAKEAYLKKSGQQTSTKQAEPPASKEFIILLLIIFVFFVVVLIHCGV